jgi:hypothetical protein
MRRQGVFGLLGLGVCAMLFGQQTAPLNFFAHAGSCEMDYDKDGRSDLLFPAYENIAREHIQLSLDSAIRLAGHTSQRVRLSRSSGAAGRFTIRCQVDFNAHFRPSVNEPLLVRVAIRAEQFQNATYRVFVHTGQRFIDMQSPTSQDTGGWMQLSMIVPVERLANGSPWLALVVEIRANEGAASGTVWIDEAQAISSRTLMRANRLPNGLRLALNFLYRNQDPYRYLEQPFGVVIGVPTPAQSLQHHYRDTIWMPYCYMPAATIPSYYRHNADLYNYDDVNRNHPDWFLLDRNGQRIFLDDTYYVDVGRQEVRERAWQSLRDFLNRCGRPRYINLDNYDLLLGNRGLMNYPTNEAWVQAVIGLDGVRGQPPAR